MSHFGIWNRSFVLATLGIGLAAGPLFAQSPQLNATFIPPNGSSSQTGTAGLEIANGTFQVDGPWVGTGSNELLPQLAVLTTDDPTTLGGAATGYLTLSITAGTPLQGSEIISNALPGYGYGYYEVQMVPDPTHVANGGVCSFFLKGAGGTLNSRTYGALEYDFEFLLNESWASGSGNGGVHLTTHPSGVSTDYSLGFNPSNAWHTYGFLWQAGNLGFYVDEVLVHTVTSSDTALPSDGTWIMANAWTGDSTWGGGPPASQINCVYNYVKFWPNVTSVPNKGPNPPTALTAIVN